MQERLKTPAPSSIVDLCSQFTWEIEKKKRKEPTASSFALLFFSNNTTSGTVSYRYNTRANLPLLIDRQQRATPTFQRKQEITKTEMANGGKLLSKIGWPVWWLLVLYVSVLSLELVIWVTLFVAIIDTPSVRGIKGPFTQWILMVVAVGLHLFIAFIHAWGKWKWWSKVEDVSRMAKNYLMWYHLVAATVMAFTFGIMLDLWNDFFVNASVFPGEIFANSITVIEQNSAYTKTFDVYVLGFIAVGAVVASVFLSIPTLYYTYRQLPGVFTKSNTEYATMLNSIKTPKKSSGISSIFV